MDLKQDPRPRLKTLPEFISAMGGIGLLPIMPGSWCSLIVALPVLLVPAEVMNVQLVYLCVALVSLALGLWSVPRVQQQWGSDPSAVVIDEALGMSITLLFPAASMGWVMWATALLFFRIFDVVKPWPISWINNRTNAWAVLADDVLAGVFAGIGVQLIAIALMGLGIVLL